MYKIDLHTHSSLSPDGGLTLEQYEAALEKGTLDCIAITDHNQVNFALAMQARHGDKIIVGEEIMTTQGELVGLYLKELVPSGLSAAQTIAIIKAQGGIVYVPHPFESVRKGVHPEVLDALLEQIDLIEVCNGRAFLQDRSAQAVLYAKLNYLLPAASSDAHGPKGLGKTYTGLKAIPTRETMLELAKSAVLITDRPKLTALLYPKYNKLKKKLKKK